MPYGDKPSSISSGVQYFFPGVLVLGPVPRQPVTDSPIDPLHRVFASNCESRHAGKGCCEWISFTWCLKFQPNRYSIYKYPLSVAASWPQVHDHPISASWVVGITFGWPHTYTTGWAFLFFSSPLFSLCPLSFCLSFLVHWATLLLFLALTHLLPRVRWHGYVYLWMEWALPQPCVEVREFLAGSVLFFHHMGLNSDHQAGYQGSLPIESSLPPKLRCFNLRIWFNWSYCLWVC